MDRSASLDLDMFHVSDHADAGPALGLHLVEVFHTGHVSDSIGSSGIGGLLAHGVCGSEIIDACNLHSFGALLGAGEVGEHCQDEKGEGGLHLINISEQSWPLNIPSKATYKYAFSHKLKCCAKIWLMASI